MTYLLDDLEAAKLIERRPDPADRRARRVVATQLGTELLATLNDRLRAAEADLLAPLDLETRETFRAQVRLLATRAEALDPLDSPGGRRALRLWPRPADAPTSSQGR
jgi:DNA-binding MarR family transcriptional regulator